RVELDLRALGEGLEALACDRAVMDEEVLASVVRGDEPVPLRVVEPLHGSCRHRKTPPLPNSRTVDGRRWADQVLALWRSKRSTGLAVVAPSFEVLQLTFWWSADLP